MTIAPGTRLGPYEIVAPIGAGGMGEVFRARDTRLNRNVAIKVLPSHLTSNPQSRERFDREAKAISSLNHPNICTLHDVGHQDGTDYLVMELVEGETLAMRISRAPLPLSQVLRYGAQTAEALAQAHRAGITHRDLKPGNIMITSSGIKLLDFGLAKLVAPPAAPGSIDQSGPTALHGPLTAEGSIVGTLQYMSPEQIEGKAVDHRTDIFSLGMILYEMATGRPAFAGSSRASLMSAILSSDPAPVRSLQPTLPPALEQIILTALEKNPDERWQTAQDVARQLRWIGEASSSGEQLRATSAQRRAVPLLLIGSGIVLGAALLVWGGMRLFSPPASQAVRARLHFSLPPGMNPVHQVDWVAFALSPDGRTLCFLAQKGGDRSLYLKSMDSFEVRKLEGSENASGPFWSSDGEWIGFSARGKLWKTNVTGETAPEAICDVSANGAVASWRDGTILFADSPGNRLEIFRVSDSGGASIPVSRASGDEWRHTWPWILPDGKHFLYQAYDRDSIDRNLVLASFDSPEKSVLLKNVSQARLVGKNQLIYVRDGMLLAQRFDSAEGKLEGKPVTLARGVSYFYPTSAAAFDASPTGVIVYRTNTRKTRLSLMDRKGTETKVLDDENLISDMSLSWDGKKAAVSVIDRATSWADIWIYDLGRGLRERFTSGPGMEVFPVWSPDNRFIVYSQNQGGTVPHIVRRDLDGSDSEALTPREEFQMARSFSSDGADLYVTRRGERTGMDILRLSMQTQKSEVLIGTEFYEGDPEVSPDGKWLAFASAGGERNEIYLQNLSEGKSSRIRLSTKGGWGPRWRRDSQELFYLTFDDQVMSVTPDAAGRWDEARHEELFRPPNDVEAFTVTPDGRSFLIVQRLPNPLDALFHVILGWQ